MAKSTLKSTLTASPSASALQVARAADEQVRPADRNRSAVVGDLEELHLEGVLLERVARLIGVFHQGGVGLGANRDDRVVGGRRQQDQRLGQRRDVFIRRVGRDWAIKLSTWPINWAAWACSRW